jgi:hypothetical protein
MCVYIYIGRRYSSPRVMDQRFITWTQRSNRTPRARPAHATRPTSCHPFDLTPPNQPRDSWPRASQPRATRPRTARHRAHLLRPTPPPSVSTASCYTSRCPTTGERPYLPLPSPLPSAPLPPPPHTSPPVSAASSYTQHLSHRCPCLLRPYASQNEWENHKMTKKITKLLRKTQNDWPLWQNPKNDWAKY